MPLDNQRFLEQVKLKAALPTGRFSDQEILDVAYDVLLADVQPFMITLREEYYTKRSSQSLVSGTEAYPINSRALGLSLRELKLATSSSQLVNLRQIGPEEAEALEGGVLGTPDSFYLEGINVVLHPTPDSGSTGLRLIQTFFQRVNRPVELASCATITNIDSITGIVTATAPSTWTTSSVYDLISRNNGNDTLAKDLNASAIGSTTITFTASDLPSSLAVGDWVVLASETPYIQVPDEVVSLVQQLTVADLLETMGDINGSQMALAKAEKLRQGLTRVLASRVQGESRKFRPQV